ncbi:MAG: DUF4301 family protein [Bacteroidales bacterium]|nr:DUF4301 family protein [Bacteroidales bacterium]
MLSTEEQISRFKNGFPWLDVVAPATPAKGIKVLDPSAGAAAVEYAKKARVNGKCKFVPASGAASRMFKDLYAGLAALEADSSKPLPEDSPAARFTREIASFAFYDKELFGQPDGSAAKQLDILRKMLGEEGLSYGTKPKGVLKFHRYPDGEVRTAVAEHLVEAQEYMKNADGSANLVLTISEQHRALFEEAIAAVAETFGKRYGVKYNIRFTTQDPATDTIAVDMDDKPFLKADGSVLRRPAGHGALIYNLNGLDEELVSIKNIDNVSCERLLPTTAYWKQVLMGCCLALRDRIFGYLRALDENPSPELCSEIRKFFAEELCVGLPSADPELLRSKLNRPIRVCGMVRNQGEPGGGPFIVRGKDGSTSLQILESVQLREMPAGGTHFNPVDLVCCLHGYKGDKFNLPDFVDPDTGFISSKSYEGRPLKALELPGLWNGAMSDWNTQFVEVPLETFNPVKTVLDLLRPAHQ